MTLMAANGIKTDTERRAFLYKHSGQLMAADEVMISRERGYRPYKYSGPPPESPLLYTSFYDTRESNMAPASDIKKQFVAEEQRKAQMVSPYFPSSWFSLWFS
jgi:hypothetical protein